MPASVVILLLVLVAVACYRATRRGAGSRLKTALLAAGLGSLTLICLVTASLLVPCALEELFPDAMPRVGPILGAPGGDMSFCPSFLPTGER